MLKRRKEDPGDICTTLVEIQTEHGARVMEKPCGRYITVEAPDLVTAEEKVQEKAAEILAGHLRRMLPKRKGDLSVLAVGLGTGRLHRMRWGLW